MDYFQSNLFSSVLAWICIVPSIGGIIGYLGSAFAETLDGGYGGPRWFLIWVLLCLLLFSPLRYILFQIVATECYMVQSFGALFSTFWLGWYVPIIFGLLYGVGIGLPVLMLYWNFGTSEKPSKLRLGFSAVMLPFGCWFGTLLFFWLLPYAAVTIHWGVSAKDVIRATNGPGLYAFYLGSLGLPIRVPGYFFKTEQNLRDIARCHVASIYLSNADQGRFVETAYPHVLKPD